MASAIALHSHIPPYHYPFVTTRTGRIAFHQGMTLGLDWIDRDAATNEKAVCDQAERRDIDKAPALINEIDEGAVNVGIFARAVIPPGLCH